MQSRRVRALVTFLLAISCVFLASSGVAQTNEFRGMWVDAWGNGFLDANQVTTLVNRCRSYNFNAIVVQMRRRGDAFYMPQAPNLEPRSKAIASNFDALQEIINQCHNGTPRIEVHCWVPTFLVGSSSSTNVANHVINVWPDLLMKNSSGDTFIGEGYYLDPGNPEAQLWNYHMARDIVSRYDIDGFHWDYIRYPTQDAGYNDVTIARYNEEYGVTGQPFPSDSRFASWRRRQVTEFLRWVNAELLAIKPHLVISTAVFSNRGDAYSNRFQDWAAWNEEGIIDICMPMTYTPNNSTFTSRINDAFNNQGVRRVYVGPGAYQNTKENTVTQLNYVRNKPFHGSVLYSYRVPNSGTVNQTETLGYIRDQFQPTWVPTPSLPWKANPTRGLIKGTVTMQGSSSPVYNAVVKLSGASSREQTTEAHGKFAFFETLPGAYSIEAFIPGKDPVSQVVNLSAGQIKTVDFTLSTNDTTVPSISDIQVTSVTDLSARITWKTDEPASSLVDYGLNTGYGNTASNAVLVKNHEIELTGLQPNTTYHYRIRSRDASNNEGVSMNQTFKTNPSGLVNDVIIESRLPNGDLTDASLYTESGFANSTLKSSAPPLSGSDIQGSRYASSGNPTFTVTPELPVAGGAYDVFISQGNAGSISDDVVVSISQTGGTGLPATTTAFRQPGGNTWELIGRMQLDDGVGSPSLTFARFSGELSGTSRMYADAVKFVYVASPPQITTQPEDQVGVAGFPAGFSVSVQGATPSFQWYFNGVEITGATESSYSIPSVQLAHQGNYQVRVNNRDGQTFSAIVQLAVEYLLARSANAGGAVSTAPSGTTFAPDTFVNVTAHPIAGHRFSHWSGDAMGSDNPTVVQMDGNKSVTAFFESEVPDIIMDNPEAQLTGSWTTATAAGVYSSNYVHAQTLIGPTPSNTAFFHPQIEVPGNYDVFIWYPQNGMPSLNARFQVGNANATNFFTVNQSTTTGMWRFIAGNRLFDTGTNGWIAALNNTGENGRNISVDAVRLRYSSSQNSSPFLIKPPVNRHVRIGDETAFTVVPGGTAPFTYQWRFEGEDIPGATANILSINSVQSANLGNYSVVVGNANGSVTADAKLLLIPPSLGSVAILSDETLRFVVEGEPGFSYTIEMSTNLTDWTVLTNLVIEGEAAEVIDSISSNQTRRFYRGRWDGYSIESLNR